MKDLKFEANLAYQHDAIAAITDIFKGQQVASGVFTVRKTEVEENLKLDVSGVSNVLKLVPEEIEENVHAIQLRNGLAPSTSEDVKTMNFSVQMETGTGKTYVYLRTIFEMNRLYGFTKFIIVVPSIAIKEGVSSSIKLMTDHFRAQYNNAPFDAFVYNSAKLECVRNFAVTNTIQIMVINIDAFRKVAADDPSRETKGNVFHRYIDKMLGRPVDFVARCNPVVIIDEPQSVDNTPKAREALALLKPLCQLRYSATHRADQRYAMMYRLDSLDAYNLKLVKQIEVASVQTQADHNAAYVRLVSVKATRGTVTAQVEIDVKKTGVTKRSVIKVKQGDDLKAKSGGRDLYEGYFVDDIVAEKGNECITFTNDKIVRLGGAVGGMLDENIKKLQIERTIVEHLDKELSLKGRGIKVLTLFFLDRVENYRVYDANGNAGKGKYAQWFEEIYAREIQKPKYHTLFHDVDTTSLPEKVHDGYFSIDGHGKSIDTSESNQAGKDAAERGYALIMKNKTLLLSFESPVKFIFSHSALKEGWDNPNVFQICTLNEVASEMRRRQMIGRGLRLCVNQDGERVHGFETNTLTVMANESFADFAANLQTEIEEETGVRFGVVEQHSFANMVVKKPGGGTEYFGTERSEATVAALKGAGYVTSAGNVTDELRKALKENALQLPPTLTPFSQEIGEVLKKLCGSLNIKNKDNKKAIHLQKQKLLTPEFKELWDRIKYKTTYRVDFDSAELVRKCVEAMKDETTLIVEHPKYVYGKGRVVVKESGVSIEGGTEIPKSVFYHDFHYPDIVGYLQNDTNLTRKTIVDILVGSGRLDDFKKNPQMFLDGTVRIIRDAMAKTLVDGIKYHKLGETEIWAQELFENDELFGYFDENDQANSNMVPTPEKGLYDYAVYDSPEIERNFALDLERSPDVKLFAKLPDWFKIPTPLGTYNPDWAVVVERDGARKLYFVVETKGTDLFNEVPVEQGAKIKCGRAHFAALGASKAGAFDYYGPIKDSQSFKSRIAEREARPSPRILETIGEELQYNGWLPLYSMRAACGKFGANEAAVREGWMEVPASVFRGARNEKLYVVRAVGHSMEPDIQDGQYVVFEYRDGTFDNNDIVLAQHNPVTDGETGGAYSIKKIVRTERPSEDAESTETESLTLQPLNPSYKPIPLPNEGEFGTDYKIVGVKRAVL